ncbi:helix-turn-helix domain-containing protein [Maricaulaceae bacterium EIL42A08]|nr:helix-turn-helix domain-containing protein [Maricaulaceae bacterium EIL42A08]
MAETSNDNALPAPDGADSPAPEPLVDMPTVANHIGLSVAALRKWRQQGIMPFPTYAVGRSLRFKMSEVDAYVSARSYRNAAEARYLAA